VPPRGFELESWVIVVQAVFFIATFTSNLF